MEVQSTLGYPGWLKVLLMISTENAEHYIWGEMCDGWHLLKRADMSVIQERVPAGGAEVMHYHERARQFFYILEGEGIEISPLAKHQFKNTSQSAVAFLVISVPSTRGDRIECVPGVEQA